MLNYSIKDFDGVKILEVTGVLNSKATEMFRQMVTRVVERESIMINLENISLITSAGMNILIELSFYAKDQGKRIIYLWPTEEIQEMVETLEVYNYLIFADSLEEGQVKITTFT